MALVHPAPGPWPNRSASCFCLPRCVYPDLNLFFLFVNSSLIQQKIHVLVTRICVQYVMTNGPYVVCVCVSCPLEVLVCVYPALQCRLCTSINSNILS